MTHSSDAFLISAIGYPDMLIASSSSFFLLSFEQQKAEDMITGFQAVDLSAVEKIEVPQAGDKANE